jgi:4-hydroxy-tetrahydrodipicolinate synthase
MEINEMRLEGIIVPMATPLLSHVEIDKKGTERLVHHMMDGGVQGIFILGTTGEATSLKPSTKKDLIEITCTEATGHTAVLVGVTHSCFDISLKLARQAKENGATAIVAAPPYFYPLDQDDLYKYFIKLADQSPLPVFLYNFPAMTKCNLEMDTVMKLAKHSNIIGIKDSSGNGVYFQKLLYVKKENPNFSVMMGPDELMSQVVLAGADGGMNAGGNVFPKLYVKLFEAAKSGNLERVNQMQPLVQEISQRIFAVHPKHSGYIAGIKESLYHFQVCEPHLAPPLSPADALAREIIRRNLEQINLKVKHVLA